MIRLFHIFIIVHKFFLKRIRFLAICSWFLLWCVWPSGSLMAALICQYHINIRTTLLVVYWVMSNMDYIIIWSNTLLSYIETVVISIETLFKDSDVCSVLIYLIGVPVSRFDFNHIEWGLFKNFGSICFCLRQFHWCLT